MRLLDAISLAFLCSTFTPSIAQWTQQTSNTTFALRSVCFLNKDTGFVVGNSGTILKTSNGGTNWLTLVSGTLKTLYSVCFLNKDTGFVCGDSGTILKTTNGGINWIVKTTNTSSDLYAISFGDYGSGSCAGQNGVLLYSSDGGETWVQKPLPWLYNNSTSNVKSIFYAGKNTGYAVGYYYVVNQGNEFLVMKTIDGGKNWLHNTSSPTIFGPLYDVFFTDTLNGWAVAKANALHSTDGGVNWSNVQVGTNYLSGISFTSLSTGYICGDSLFYSSNDTGKTWGIYNFGNGVVLSDSEFPAKSIGYIVGNSGRIYKTTNGGAVGLGETNRILATLKIFPNPSKGTLNIEYFKDMHSVRVFNVLGELVRSIGSVNQSSLRIDMSASPKGIYLIEVMDKTGLITRGKLILE